MMSVCNKPVLFMIFNRPELTRLVFERIRSAKPPLLFIAADGPRPDHPDEKALCRECRSVVEKVDWPCEIHTLFRENNLGCGYAVSSAITWFFEKVESGIILEDDCIPHPNFFRYCCELLEKYADDTQVMSISGTRFNVPNIPDISSSYDFSIYHHIWGWATWRRAWNLYEKSILPDNPVLHPNKLLELLQNPEMVALWSKIGSEYQSGQIDTWDYPWLFTCWKHEGLSIRPRNNLISNQGFGPSATHTKQKNQLLADVQSTPMSFPLQAPQTVGRNKALEDESIAVFLPQASGGGSKTSPAPQPMGFLRRFIHFLKHRIPGSESVFTALHQWALDQAVRIRNVNDRRKASHYFRIAKDQGVPGADFFTYGCRTAKRIASHDRKLANPLFLVPVDTTRYYEFDFAWRMIQAFQGTRSTMLDMSSPYLFSFRVAETFTDSHVRMINPDAADLRGVRKRAEAGNIPRLSLEELSVQELDAEAETSYDVIWSISVLEHIYGEDIDDQESVQILWSKLKPGGRLLLTVPTDKTYWEEFRSKDAYGQISQQGDEPVFFQRFYDEKAIHSRIIDPLGVTPERIEWFGVKTPGVFHDMIDGRLKKTRPLGSEHIIEMATSYQMYPTFETMPGEGVCGLCFRKPATEAEE